MKLAPNRYSSALVIGLALLAGCARSEEASLVQPDSKEGYNQVGKVGSPEADDREPAIGQWRASLQENVQALEFGPVGTEPLVSLLCNGKTSVLLQRHGGAPAGPLPAMQIAKGELNEQLPVSAGGGAVPMLRAQVPLPSPLADLVASGGEPLMIRLDDGPPLVLPPSALIGDYLRSCSTAQPLPMTQGGTGAGPAAGNSTAAAPLPAAPGNGTAPAPAANTGQPK